MSDRQYTIHLPTFEGSIADLLKAVDSQKIDLKTLSLSRITQQFLTFIQTDQPTPVPVLSEFLVGMAKLIWLKSKGLLPAPPPLPPEEEEVDPSALAHRLAVYQRFKTVSQNLLEKQVEGVRSFLRLVPPPKKLPQPETKEITVTFGMDGPFDLNKLIQAAQKVLLKKPPEPSVDTVMSPEVVTIGDRINLIRSRLQLEETIYFTSLLTDIQSRVGIVVTLLAVLELIKNRQIEVRQLEDFGEIVISLHPNLKRDEIGV